MVTYQLIPTPKVADEQTIFSANNGQGYIKDGELHIIGGGHHFVYKDGKWYMKNPITQIDHYLGEGACPTVNLDSINVLNQEYWDALIIHPENKDEENVGSEI